MCFFNVVHLAVHTQTKNLLKMWLMNTDSWKKNAFYVPPPPPPPKKKKKKKKKTKRYQIITFNFR